MESYPNEDNSELQPVVTFVTIADRVALLQLPSPQREVSQVLIGSTMDILTKLGSVIILTNGAGSKHAFASASAESCCNADLQPDDRLWGKSEDMFNEMNRTTFNAALTFRSLCSSLRTLCSTGQTLGPRRGQEL